MKNKFIASYYGISIFSSIIYYMMATSSFWNSESTLSIICNLTIISVGLFIIWDYPNRKKRGVFRSGIIFLISFIIVHFQLYYDEVYFAVKYGMVDMFSTEILNKSALLSYVGLESFLFGYVITRESKVSKIYSRNIVAKLDLRPLRCVLLILLLLVLYFGRGYLFEMAYGSVNTTATAYEYVNLLFGMTLYSYLIFTAINCRNKGNTLGWFDFVRYVGTLVNVIIVIYIIAILSSGDRGSAIIAVVAYIFSAQIGLNRKIRTGLFVILLLFAGVGISIWGIVRSSHSTDNVGEMIISAYDQVKEEESISPVTFELANSVKTVHYSVKMVPESIHHTNGVFQVAYIIQSIPFLGSWINQTLFDDAKFIQSTAFITWLIQGNNPTSGDGTSCIADAYIDFGIGGVIILLFLFGVLSRKSDRLLTDNVGMLPHFKVSLYFIIACTSYYFPRSAFLFHFKDVLWLFIIMTMIYMFAKKRKQWKTKVSYV